MADCFGALAEGMFAATGELVGSSVCVRFRGFPTLSERAGYDKDRRCELHEIVRGGFDFEQVASHFA
jgi:hypothetical protein